MPLTAAGEIVALNALLSGRYISAHTGDPTVGNEVSGNAYARVAGGTFSNSGSNPTTASNDGVIEFPIATGSWGTVTYFGIWTAISGGDLIAYGALAVPKAISEADVLRFIAGALEVEAD